MTKHFLRILTVFLSAFPVYAQPRVDPNNTYERLLCVMPMVGSGTWDDPKRPQYAPAPSQVGPGNRGGIIAFHHQVSDDGNSALVEFVATDRAALSQILSITDPNVKVFQKGKSKKDDIEKEFKKYKKDFDFNSFQVRVP